MAGAAAGVREIEVSCGAGADAGAATSPTFAAAAVVVCSRRGDNVVGCLVPGLAFDAWRGLFTLAAIHRLIISRVRCGEEGSEPPDIGAGGGANDGDVAARTRVIAAIGTADARATWCGLDIALVSCARR